jgi:hypothetical protein
MTPSDLTGARWRKSARSDGANTCVEATVVPAGARWRTSARSDSTACVEATTDGLVVVVRNSTDPDGPALAVTAADWDTFLDVVRTGALDHPALGPAAPAGPFTVALGADATVILTTAGDPEPTAVRYTRVEWEVFTAGVTLDREFTLDWLLAAA